MNLPVQTPEGKLSTVDLTFSDDDDFVVFETPLPRKRKLSTPPDCTLPPKLPKVSKSLSRQAMYTNREYCDCINKYKVKQKKKAKLEIYYNKIVDANCYKWTCDTKTCHFMKETNKVTDELA